jgi:hypothetical protein
MDKMKRKNTLILTDKPDKILFFKNFIHDARNSLGGLILSIIIPPKFIHLMSNVLLETHPSDTEFYLYGWYEQHRFPIYVDETLIDDVYLICNCKNMKLNIVGD